MNTPILNQLVKLNKDGRRPFHMPGHKRKCKVYPDAAAGQYEDYAFINTGMWSMDITEITDYDNLHAPEGIIRESMDQLKEIYHTRESWYLVGGSSCGILAAISAVCSPGDKIIIGRNCHKAVYNAVRLLRLHTLYLYPRQSLTYDILLDTGEAEREQLTSMLRENPDVRAVVLTSPTYEGVVTDVRAVKNVLETYFLNSQAGPGNTDTDNVSRYYDPAPVLIIDEAHGAHMHFHQAFPESAVSCGADIVIQSTHKTLPSMTQTALLHLCTDRVKAERIADWLAVYETSSPSYPLMASAEYGVAFMYEKKDYVDKYVDNLLKFRRKCGQLKEIHLVSQKDLSVYDFDPGKLIFYVGCNRGPWLFAKLRDEWNMELEMESRSYVLAMTSVMDEEKDFNALWEAVSSIDREITEGKKDGKAERIFLQNLPYPKRYKEPWEINSEEIYYASPEEAAGQLAASYIMLYPPGIPLLVPGEKIIKEMVENIEFYLYNGYNVQGLSHGRIPIVRGK